MRNICFIDKTFDNTQTLLYHLSIQISLDGFSFCILDIPKGKYIVLKEFPLYLKRSRLILKRLDEIIATEEVLSREFKSIEISFETPRVTLVPQVIYSRGTAERYFHFNHLPEKANTVTKTLLTKAGAWCIFDIPSNLNDYLQQKFPKAELRHHAYPLIESALKHNKSNEGKKEVHLNFGRHHFDFVAINGPELLLYNSYEYKNEDDILYYVMFAFDQLKLPPEKTQIIVHGKVPRVAPYFHQLKKYINKVNFAQLDSTYLYSYTFNQVPAHYYTMLLNLYKCG